MQYETDGSRLLLIDVPGRRAIHVQLRPSPDLINREITIRQRAGRASPPILFHDAGQGVIAERWLPLRPASPTRPTLAEAIRLLKATLYAPRPVGIDEYLGRLGGAVDAARAREFVAAYGVERVAITDSHGDLWPANVGVDEHGGIVLLDWEYARVCVESHDLWSYIFQAQRSSGRPFDQAFLADFAACQRDLLGMAVTDTTARAYHFLHLMERHTLFLELALPHKKEELRFLRAEIDACLATPS